MKIKLLILTMLFIPIMFGCSKEEQLKKLLIGEWYLFMNQNRFYTRFYTREESPLHYIFYQDNSYVLLADGDKKKSGKWHIINLSDKKTWVEGEINMDDAMYKFILDFQTYIGGVKTDVLILKPKDSPDNQKNFLRY